jgi:Domain of unknown function (DUF4189)
MNHKCGPLLCRSVVTMKSTAVIFIGLMLASGYANAEGHCPKGYYPYNATGAQVACAPIPGYGGGDQPVDPGPRWASLWGAIAVGSDRSGGVLGTASDMSSKRKAEQRAMKECKNRGGDRNCRVEISYRNQCGVIAWGDRYYHTARADSSDNAAEMAMKGCNGKTSNCRVFHSSCSYPQRMR